MIQMGMNQIVQALQLMTTDIEAHDNYDIARFTEEVDHLNL